MKIFMGKWWKIYSLSPINKFFEQMKICSTKIVYTRTHGLWLILTFSRQSHVFNICCWLALLLQISCKFLEVEVLPQAFCMSASYLGWGSVYIQHELFTFTVGK